METIKLSAGRLRLKDVVRGTRVMGEFIAIMELGDETGE